MSEGRISGAQKEAEGPSGDSHTSTDSVFHSDDLTSSSSSLEILSRRLLAPLQKVKNIHNFLIKGPPVYVLAKVFSYLMTKSIYKFC